MGWGHDLCWLTATKHTHTTTHHFSLPASRIWEQNTLCKPVCAFERDLASEREGKGSSERLRKWQLMEELIEG